MVTSYDHVKPGKGPAYTQVKLKNLLTGSHQEKRFRSGVVVEQAILDRRELTYLYSDSTGAVFMDNESYDQTNIPKEVLGNTLEFMVEDTAIISLMYQNNVVSIELPATVELKIVNTPPGIKEATKSSQLKEATCETGLKTRVPAFIEVDEVVKISTDTGEYLGRA
jgi:elongation factor P